MKETIRLFKAVPLKDKVPRKVDYNSGSIKTIMELTVKRGYIFSKEILESYSDAGLYDLVESLEKEFGLTAEQMNAAFHKSWAKVRDASMEQLVLEQIMHYITTYGFETAGCYSEDTVYIPNEELDAPELTLDGLKLVIIRGLSDEDLKDKLMGLLTSGIALKETTIQDVLSVCEYLKLNADDIDLIKNKEVKIALYDVYGVVPKEPVEFLRYALFKSIGETLLIKNEDTIFKIKNDGEDILELFVNYSKSHGLKKLASIFNRFKPLFLAFKGHQQMNAIINKIRKLAVKYHKPMPRDYLNNVTSMIKNDAVIDFNKLNDELDRVNIFRKIRLAYALQFRTANPESILYKVRNGKGYAKEFSSINSDAVEDVLNIVKDSIIDGISEKMRGKKVYIPDHITYALPATEKQFSGNFPIGTCVTTDKDMIFGVHWENTDGHSIDLDLSLLNAGGKIGWDAAYRDDARNVLFSGDVTNAPLPKGASELFYVKKQNNASHLLMCNYYNHMADVPVPIQIMVGKETIGSLKKNYMIDPNNVITALPSIITNKQTTLGLLITTPEECKFYFTESSVGNSISSRDSPVAEHTRNYLNDYYSNMISLNDVLVESGAVLVDSVDDCEFDLSPEALEKNTILGLLQ